jgi:hypothetical protein
MTTIRVRSLAVILAVLCAGSLASAGEDDLFRGPDGFKGIKYRWVGPAVGGRATRVQGVPGSPGVYWLRDGPPGRSSSPPTAA